MRWWYFLLFIVGIFSVIGSYLIFQSVAQDRLIFLSVGQGDSTLIETMDRQRVLIDGGPDATAEKKLAKFMPFWDRRIDRVVLTHSHADHAKGLEAVLQRYEVGSLLLTEEAINSIESRGVIEVARQRSVPIVILNKKYRLEFSDESYLELAPGIKIADVNEASILAYWVHGSTTAALLADVGGEREQELVKEARKNVQIMRLGHHGSDLGTTDSLLRSWKPEIAIISVGKNNKFKHPSGRVLKRLERFGVEIMRTDFQGDLIYYYTPDGWQLEKS